MITGVMKINQVLQSINLKNFFTHKDTTIEFKSGLNYIVGPEGSGKSLILEAIAFCFFGTVALRDVAASYKQSEATLIFNYLNKEFKIVRKVNDAILYLKDNNLWTKVVVGTTPVNQQIINLFGYDYSIFILSNYCQQGELQSFSKMTPAKKIAFIDKVSGIDDAKEFIKFLEDRKKFLKSEITTTSRYVIEPVFSSDISFLTVDIDDILSDLEIKKQSLLSHSINRITLENNLLKLKNNLSTFILQNKKTNTVYNQMLLDYNNSVEQIKKDHCDYIIKVIQLASVQKEIHKIETTNYIEDFNTKDTVEDLETYIANVAYNKKVETKLQLLKSQVAECPNCAHSFSIAHKELEAYQLIGTDKIDLPKKHKLPEELLYFLKNIQPEYKLLKNNESILLADLNKFKSYFKNFEKITPAEFSHSIEKYIQEVNSFTQLKFQYEVEIENLQNEIEQQVESNTHQISNEISEEIYKYTKIKTEIEIYKKSKELYDKASASLAKLKTEFDFITKVITQATEDTFKIKQAAIPLINYHASVLVNNMTDSVISKVTITDSYDILVNNKNINVCCGSEKDTASLAFRLSLGNSIILGMLPLFLGDEIDAASKMERSVLMTEVLQNMSDLGYQVLLITHKDTSNFENCNIIDLQQVV